MSLYEVMPGRGFDVAMGDTPRYIIMSGGAPFKIEGVEVERHHKEDGGKMV